MRFQWHPVKARRNREKHGVDFADAVGVFEDPLAITLEDPHPGEERLLTLGMDGALRILVVSWLWRGEEIRVVSARRATARERRQYHEVGDAR
jgi:hypothetical protein